MYRMINPIRPYAWGSTTALPSLLGRAPTGEPQAELWMGAHPDDPSRVQVPGTGGGLDQIVSLLDLIDRDADAALGRRTARRFGRLPYLLKILAAEEPLSLQVHPSLPDAQAGFRDEEARGVPREAPYRLYKDDNHKPEMIVALTWFHALCGFRDAADTADLFDALGVKRLREFATDLRTRGGAALLHSLTRLLMTSTPVLQDVVCQTGEACRRVADGGGRWAQEARWAASLESHYPGDAGVVVALMLNHVRLRPGEALFLPAGNLHAYLHGVGVEIMANSDNVIRGGLTPKHVDVEELLHVLDTTPMPVPSVRPTVVGSVSRYRPPVAEFQLDRVALAQSAGHSLSRGLPRIVLVTEGSALLESGGERMSLAKGESCFVVAADPDVAVSGEGVAYVASPGRESFG